MYLLVNTGSSSVKLTLFHQGRARRHQSSPPDASLDLRAFAGEEPLRAVAHRFVHGGELRRHCIVDRRSEERLRAASVLAPLHNPPALRGLAAARRAFPGVPQLAILDTAFFAELPAVAQSYAIAPELGIRRYGFHGLAHASMARQCAGLERRPRRLVTLQLGAGCSAAALHDGRPIDTSMGFSPAEGLVMATRAGDVDPGALVHLVRERGYSAAQLDELVNERSGLLGLCGQSSMSAVVEAAERGDARAALALDLYGYRIQKTIGAYAAALGGLDAIAFGGGVGESVAAVHAAVLKPLRWLGLELREPAAPDERRPPRGDAEVRTLTSDTSPVAAYVVHVDEAAEMAHAAEVLLTGLARDRAEPA